VGVRGQLHPDIVGKARASAAAAVSAKARALEFLFM
jgi:hypothetical protein